VFVDETGVNLAMSRLYARALKGKRAVGDRPDGRGKNLTLVGAMALQGIVAAMTFFGGCDRYAFTTFVEKVLIPNLWAGAVVVMDNFSSHQVAGIRKAIEAVGAKLIYLSPYSPDFSPIELYWSKIKEFLRTQAARSYSALDEAITAAINAIAPQDILGWFRHCGYCVPSN
jgi:transposase